MDCCTKPITCETASPSDAADADRARVRRDVPAHERGERAFPRAASAEHRDLLTEGDRERKSVEHASVCSGIGKRDGVHADDGCAVGRVGDMVGLVVGLCRVRQGVKPLDRLPMRKRADSRLGQGGERVDEREHADGERRDPVRRLCSASPERARRPCGEHDEQDRKDDLHGKIG